MLDNDVVDLMESLYPTIPALEAISQNDVQMSNFWTRIAHGRSLLQDRITSMKQRARAAAMADGNDASDED